MACFFSVGLAAVDINVSAIESKPSDTTFSSPLNAATAFGSRLPETGAFLAVVPIAAAAVPGRLASEYGLLRLHRKTALLVREAFLIEKYEHALLSTYLVPTLPYCSASFGLEADVTKPSPYLFATF